MTRLVLNHSLRHAYRVVGEHYIPVPYFIALAWIQVGSAYEIQEA